MVPWPQVLIRISDFYHRNRDQLEENAENIVKNMIAANAPMASTQTAIDQTLLLNSSTEFTRRHDDEFGGFGPAPKFPPSMAINYLMQVRQGWMEVSRKDAEDNPAIERIDSIIDTTLTGMARGGIFDQIGGGFARYSVDRYWTIPHFEKMLYDNGLLLDTYARAFLTYGEKDSLYKGHRGGNGGLGIARDAFRERRILLRFRRGQRRGGRQILRLEAGRNCGSSGQGGRRVILPSLRHYQCRQL